MDSEVRALLKRGAENGPDGVMVHRLQVHRDPRGTLMEVLRTDWEEVVSPAVPIAQAYVSVTGPRIARDEDRWHLHQRQTDRFVCLAGHLVFALAQARDNNWGVPSTVALVDLVAEDDAPAPHLLVVPPGVLHGFVVVGNTAAVLLSMPSQLHDGSDDLRIPFAKAEVRFPNGIPFQYDAVRAIFAGTNE